MNKPSEVINALWEDAKMLRSKGGTSRAVHALGLEIRALTVAMLSAHGTPEFNMADDTTKVSSK